MSRACVRCAKTVPCRANATQAISDSQGPCFGQSLHRFGQTVGWAHRVGAVQAKVWGTRLLASVYATPPVPPILQSRQGPIEAGDLSRQNPIQPSAERGRIDSPRLACQLSAIAKQDQGRNAADIEAPGQLRLLIRIDLAYLKSRRALLGGVIEYGGHHLAGTTPRRPEIHQDRQAALGCMGRKRGGIESDRLADEQLRLALRALGVFAHTIGWRAYDGVALRAGHQNRISRGCGVRVHSPQTTGACAGRFQPSCLDAVVSPFQALN